MARDDLIHFLQDAYHLKDWLKHDPVSSSVTGTVEADITADDSLTMCADLGNATKHLSNQTGRRNGPRAEFGSQSVEVNLPVNPDRAHLIARLPGRSADQARPSSRLQACDPTST
jgi:hypothetical protein